MELNGKSRRAGGCLCGHVRYELTQPPEGATYCHCDDCRRTTGSVFNVGVRVRRASLAILSGTPKAYTKTADSGNLITREFCPECGSSLFTRSPAHPDYVFVKAGTLDDPSVVKPVDQIWTSKKVPWAEIDPDLPAFARNRDQSKNQVVQHPD